MKTIGITGPTGCGKTTFLQEIAARGGVIVDCDALYYELLKTDPALKAALQKAFGDVFLPDGTLNRKSLAARVFSNRQALDTLNGIVFFHVGNAVQALRAQAQADGKPLFAIDAINLFESGMAGSCDVTVGILAPKPVRLARIMARDHLSEPAAQARIDAQKPDAFYRTSCQVVLTNDTSLEAFRDASRRLLNDITKEETP